MENMKFHSATESSLNFWCRIISLNVIHREKIV